MENIIYNSTYCPLRTFLDHNWHSTSFAALDTIVFDRRYDFPVLQMLKMERDTDVEAQP